MDEKGTEAIAKGVVEDRGRDENGRQDFEDRIEEAMVGDCWKKAASPAPLPPHWGSSTARRTATPVTMV